jgi:hypothetical protein
MLQSGGVAECCSGFVVDILEYYELIMCGKKPWEPEIVLVFGVSFSRKALGGNLSTLS